MEKYELFFKKSVIGAWLEEYLEEKEISKVKFCKDCGLSRPTLDKILAGLITNSTTYYKHILKIIDYLKMTPESFEKLIAHSHDNDMKSVRAAFKISSKTLSDITGIPISRLKKIESGKEEFTQAELTDCALTCNVDKNAILGKSVFYVQTDVPELFIYGDDKEGFPSGMWGCLCIKSGSLKEDLKYWITEQAMLRARRELNNQFIVIPCLNNKLLLINTDNIDELRFMGFNGDYYEGEPKELNSQIFPPQIFRVLNQYFDGYGSDNKALSKKAIETCEDIIKEFKITEDKVFSLSREINIYYKDKKESSYFIEGSDDLYNYIDFIYNMEIADMDMKFIEIENFDGSFDQINLNNVVCIKMPLNLVEDEIIKMHEEG